MPCSTMLLVAIAAYCVSQIFIFTPIMTRLLFGSVWKKLPQDSSFRKPESPITVIILEKPWGTHYRLKTYVKESREQFLFLTDLTVRGKEAIRSLGIRFVQATYAETKR